MVTEEHLSADEARQLAKDIQTAKEHNLREIGLRLIALKESGFNQKEIAELEGYLRLKLRGAAGGGRTARLDFSVPGSVGAIV